MSPDTQSPPAGGAPEEASGKSPASFKVELDLEDAPFLEEVEEAPPPPKKPAEPAKETQAAAPQKTKAPSALKARLAALLANKKRLAIVGGGLLVLLLAPLVLMLVFSGEKKPPPPPPAPAPEVLTQSVTPPRQDAPPGPKFLFKGEPFMIELRGTEGQIRFLRCRFSIPTENPALYGELMAKNIAVRDAIYYYLSNKPLTFLVDSKAHEALKLDLISVINEHISAEKIHELYIEDYYVTGK